MARSVATLVASMALDAASFVTDIDRAAKRSQAALRKFRKTAETASKAIGSAIGVGLGVAIHEAIKFEKAMAEVGTLLDDTRGLDATADAIKRLSVEFGQAPTDQAKALYQIISAGASDATEQVELLTASNRLALGGVTDVATAADGLTTVLNAYAGSGLTASEVSDSLFTTMKQGKTTIEELSSSVGNVATIAAQTGVSLREVGAAVGTLTKSGIATGEAMNALRGVLAAVLKQSKQSTDTAADLGVAFSVSALQAQGLAGFLQQIADSGATEEQLAKLFGRVEGLSAVMAIGANDAKEFTAQLAAQAKAAGATEDAVAKMADTTALKVAQAKSAFQVLSVEVGETFLSAISDVTVAITENIDEVRDSVTKLAKAVASAARIIIDNFDQVASAISGLLVIRTLLPILGAFGPVGVAAALAIGGVTSALVYLNLAGDETRRVIDDLAETLEFATGKWGEYATAADIVEKQAKIRKDLIAIDQQLLKVTEELESKQRALNETEGVRFEELERLRAQQEKLTKAYHDGVGALVTLGSQLKQLNGDFSSVADKFSDTASSFIDDILGAPPALNETSAAAKRAAKAADEAAKKWKKLSGEISSFVDDVLDTDAFDSLVDQVESLIDTLDPVGAQFRKFAEMAKFAEENAQLFENRGYALQDVMALINIQARETITGMLGLADGSKVAADQIVTDADRMKEAALEGVRQITDAFLDMWSDILSGSESSFDGIQEAFSKMMASIIHQATTQKIQLQFEQAFGEGGGGFTDLNAKELGISFGALAAAQFSDDIVQGLFGDASTTDYVEIGQQIGTVVGAVIGSIIPVIGTALGAALGAIAGSIDGLIFGKLFGRKFFADIGGTEVGRAANPAADAQAFSTALGEIVGIKGRGGFGNFNDPETPGGQIKQAIEVFDQAIYDVLKSVGASDEIRTIISDLETWRIQTGNAATAVEDIIQSRFDVVLQGFSDEVKDFVSQTESVEEQIGRLSVALAGQKLFDEAPELFGDRTLGDFLAVVEAVDGGLGELGETFQALSQQLLEIGGLTQFLSDFAASDIESDFNLLVEAQRRSIADALTAVNEKLFDAVANFDGSIESLQEIAGLVATVREGEIRYLQQLDSIQRGLNANLETLKQDILGLTAPELDATEVLSQARGLISEVQFSTSAEDVADIGQQFNALIRSLGEEDQVFNQGMILALINDFQRAANSVIDQFRTDAVDNADSMRDLVDVFLNDIGDPLSIIAATNERAAQALELLAGTQIQPEALNVTPLDSEGYDFSEQEIILSNGLADMNETVGEIGPAVANAILQGLGNVQIIINQDPSLVNQ